MMHRLLQALSNNTRLKSSNVDKITSLPIELIKEIEIYLCIDEIKSLRCTSTVFYNFITNFSVNIYGLNFFDIYMLREITTSFTIPSINNDNDDYVNFDNLLVNELVITSLKIPLDTKINLNNIISTNIQTLIIKEISLSPFNKNKLILPDLVNYLIIPESITITNGRGYISNHNIKHEHFINLDDYDIYKVAKEHKSIRCFYSVFHILSLPHQCHKRITYLYYHLTKKMIL